MNIEKHLLTVKYESFLEIQPIKSAYKTYFYSKIFDDKLLNGIDEFFMSYSISDQCNTGFSGYHLNFDENLCCCEYDALDTSGYADCWMPSDLLFFIGCLHSSTFNEDLLFFANDSFIHYCAFTKKAFVYCLSKGLLFRNNKHLEDYPFIEEKALKQLTFMHIEMDGLRHKDFNVHIGAEILFIPENVNIETPKF